jgi:hypothetical protein
VTPPNAISGAPAVKVSQTRPTEYLVAFPQFCRIVAQDGYLPRSFTMPWRRLVLTRNVVRLGRDHFTAILATPTRTQHRALDLLGVTPTP